MDTYIWGRGVLPYLGMVGTFCGDDPVFVIIDLICPYCMVQYKYIDPLFLQKIFEPIDPFFISFRSY